MYSKNNKYMQEQKSANRAQRFSLRKLSIGTVSVLLGTLMFFGNGQVSADTTTDTDTSADTASVNSAANDTSASAVTLSSTGSSAASDANSSAAASSAAASAQTATAAAASTSTTDSSQAASTASSAASSASATTTDASSAASTAATATTDASTATTANSQAASDDVASSKGQILATDKISDSDVTPGMSAANGASVVADESKIPSGYKADPTDGRYTFGIVSLGPFTTSEKSTTYNGENGTNYYFRFSTSKTATNGQYDDTVYAQLVDADTDQVLWEGTLTVNGATVQVDKLKTVISDGSTHHYQLTYMANTTNGVTTKQIEVNSDVGTQYAKVVYDAANSSNTSSGTVTHVMYPDESTIRTEYIAKDAAGNETILADYEQTGRQGYTYTASGVRIFKGFDLISSPSNTTGALSASYKVGDIIVSAQKQLSDQLQIARINVITDTNGTARVVLKVAALGASIDDIADESIWKTILASDPVAPGEFGNNGNYDADTHKNGAFLLYTLSGDPIGVKYLTDAGFTQDQLTGYGKYLTIYGLNNRLAVGQEPVQYYYAPQGQVRINYVTSDGTVIQTPMTAYENSGNNTSYDVSGSTYKPETITVNGKTYRYVKSDKSMGTAGTTTVNGFTYNTTPSDATGTISSNNVNDVYYVYEQVTYHTGAETKDVTRTIEYYDSVTGEPIPSNLESTVTQTATLTRNKIYDDQGNFIGYGTVSADGSSYTIDDSWKVDAQTWTQQDSANLSDYGYTAPDRASVAAVTVDGDTTNVTEKVYYGHQTMPVTPTDPKTPGEPINPKGDVTYPDGVAKDDLNATVKRTINYVDEDGNKVNGAPDGTSSYVQTAEFTRTAIVDKVTGKILGYDTDNDGKVDTENANRAWTPIEKTLDAVKSADPSSVGYDNVDTANVSSLVVTPGEGDTTVTVKYSKNQTYHTDVETKNVTRTIEYYDSVTGEAIPTNLEATVTQTATLKRNKIYDDQNNFIGYGTVSADGSSYTIDDSWKAGAQTWTQQDSADLSDYGYTAPDRASVAAVTVDGNTTNVTEKVYYGHQTTPVTPTNPGTPGQPINPKGDVTYPNGVAKDDLTDTVTRTINYVDAQGNPVKGGPNGEETITQTVTFERTAIVDKVTGEILGYDTDNDGKVDTESGDRAWSPLHGEFDEVESKTPAEVGFDHVDREKVNVYGVEPGDSDIVEQVVYSNDPMVVAGTIQYVDDTTSVLLDEDALPEGEVGSKINYTTAAEIKKYENQGYELVSSDFTDGTQTYAKEGNDFVVHLKHATKTITPNDPNQVTPGQPINPNDPNSPVYPTDVDRKNLVKDATQTIHYVGAGDDTPADDPKVQKDAFTRTVTIDKVTGKVFSTSDWEGTKTFDTVDTPVVDGYHADKKVAGGLTATPDNPNVEETVTYTPNGKLIPVDENGTPIPGADTPTYTTDPDDPTKVLNPTVPSIDGWKPKDNQPGDSITPNGPGEDTKVPYVQVVSGTIKYVDDTTNATLDQGTLPAGEVGTKINYTTADKIKNYQDLGYELVSSNFSDGTQTYAKDGNDFVVHLKHATKTITPEDPATPGQPINPKGNAEYPNGVAKDDLTDTVTRTINYVDADGNPVKGGPNGETTIKQTVTFKRAAVIDKVTGQLLGYDTNNDGQVDTTDAERAWSPMHGEFDEVESKTPAEVGYLHVDRPKVNVYGVVPGDQDIVEKVVYSNDPMVVAGTIQYIDDTTGVLLDEDVLPEGEVGTKISYTTADKIKNYENKGYELVSNNFTDGAQTYSKDGNDFVVHLKHKTQTITPNDPDLVTPGESINPNDPNSPVYPPATARENLIKAATQTIHYVGAGDQTPADKVQTKEDAFTRTVTIDKVTGKVLSTSDWQGSETFGTENTPVVDGYHADKKTAGGLTATVADPNVEETVTYTPNAKIVPVDPNGNPIPGADTPTYPTDPTDPTKVVPNEPIPDVPGYTPVDPSPITPTDPGKDTPVPYTQNQYGLTEQFVDEDGNELSPSVSKGSSYKHGDAFDVTGDAKVINGYVLVKQENTKGTFGNGDETAKFIYKKLGRIIPVDPNGNPIPGADTPIYQNDPNDPSKVVPNEPTPTVPGYTPSTPSVTPADPTKDTPVPYTKNETPTNPSEPTTPANPTNPSEPTAPGTPTNPTEPSPAVPGQTTPANQQAASSASEDKSATLPQTGNDQNETAVAAGLGLAGLLSLLALFGTRKKRHED